MNINPLDVPGTMFEVELLNPNPTSSKKGYRISFQVSEEVHSAFMRAREGNLRILARMAVVPDTDEQVAHDAVNGKPKRKPKEPTPHGAMWRELYIAGFPGCPGVLEAREPYFGTGMVVREQMRKVFGVASLSREVGQEQIYAKFPPNEFPQVQVMVEQALRKAGA